MRQILLCLSLIFFFGGNTSAQIPDSSQYIVLPYEVLSRYAAEFPFKTTASDINGKELEQAERLLVACITQYNIEQQEAYEMAKSWSHTVRRSDFGIDLKKYKRQYVVFTKPNGDKYLWINFLCRDPHNIWKQSLVRADGGGSCYFNLKFNLTQNYYYGFYVNSVD